MKFGLRTPSLNKRIAAKTSLKRVVQNSLGIKAPRGWGWLTNPKKAAYNRVYNRTTFGCGTLILIGLFVLIAGFAFARGGGGGHSSHNSSSGTVHVNGYFKSNGTYVQPHYRSAPDGNFDNNWSTKGNINPYTGKEGTKTTPPDDYKGSSSSTGSSEYFKPDSNNNTSTDKSVIPDQTNLPRESPPTIDKSSIKIRPSTSKTPTNHSSIVIPANAKLNYRGNGWECNSGYFKKGDKCLSVNVPTNGKLNYRGNGWECNSGYVKRGEACEIVKVPLNAKLNYSGHGWECDHGYSHRGDSCVAVNVPQNAKLNYSGHGWECNYGFARNGDVCRAIELPQNAKLNYSGHSWECNRGYVRRSEFCIPLVSK